MNNEKKSIALPIGYKRCSECNCLWETEQSGTDCPQCKLNEKASGMEKFEITITETRKATLEIDPANYPEGSTKEEMIAIEKKGAETQVEYMDMLDATSEIEVDHFSHRRIKPR